MFALSFSALLATFISFFYWPTHSPASGSIELVSTNPQANLEHFPFKYTIETGLPDYSSVRVEGHTPDYVKSHGLGYFKKVKNPKLSAPIEELAYFEAQHALQQSLKNIKGSLSEARVRLGFAGDMMWLRHGWSEFMNDNLRSYLKGMDGFFANLETAIARSFSVPNVLPARATFNSKPELVTSFKDVDGKYLISGLSVANNHMLDYDEQGLKETMDFLQREGIPFSGARHKTEEKPYFVVEIGGFKIGFYAWTYGINDPNKFSETSLLINRLTDLVPYYRTENLPYAEIEKNLRAMEQDGIDFKIISVHWGHEYEFYPQPEQMQVARKLIELGADLIMGHHPHVQQPNEVCFVNGYEASLPKGTVNNNPGLRCTLKDTGNKQPRKALVMYSLGNFLSNMYGFTHMFYSIALIQSIELYRQNGVVDWQDLSMRLLVNDRGSDTGFSRIFKPRQLYLFEDYVAARCKPSGVCKEEDQANFDFIRDLMGPFHF